VTKGDASASPFFYFFLHTYTSYAFKEHVVKLTELYGFEKKAKKLSTSDLRKMIVEALNEKADPSKVEDDRFPMNLSSVDAEFAKKAVNTEPAKEDTIPVTGASEPVQKLKPSQSSMNIEKAMGQAISMILGDMELGGNINAFISNDDHIMDGHHRWVATAMVDPSQPVGGYKVDFPADKLIAILNAITAGKFGITQGKPATGGFDQFKPGPVKATLQQFAKEGVPGKFPRPPEQVMQALEKFVADNGGEEKGEEAVEKAAEIMVNNLSNLKVETPAGAPSREDMPVIDDPQPAIQALTTGEVDVNPPYQVDEDQPEVKEESKKSSDNVLVERWTRIAGIK